LAALNLGLVKWFESEKKLESEEHIDAFTHGDK
jgi:hypothetical protein